MGILDDAFSAYNGGDNNGILGFYNRLMDMIQPNQQSGNGAPQGWSPPAAMGAATSPRIGYTPAEGGQSAESAPQGSAAIPPAGPQSPSGPDFGSMIGGLGKFAGGVGDRLGAGLTGALNSGSPLSAVSNLLGGLTSGQRTDPYGMMLRQQQAVYQQLVKGGTPPGQAAVIAQSPKAMELWIAQQVAPKYQAQKLQGLTGEEPATFDQTRGIWLDATGKPLASGAGTSIPRGPDGQPLQGQDLLQHYKKNDPAAASMIEAIIRGDAGVTGRNLQKFMPVATLVDPTLSQFNYDARKKTALEFAPGGKSANNVKSLETVGGHIDKMMDAFDKLGNTWQPEYNSVKNWVAQRLGAGGVNAYETAANGVANELGSVFRSYGMSDAEVKSWRDRIATANSPEQFQAGMGMLLDMLKTRKEALQEQYQQGLGKSAPPEQFQKLDAAIGKIQGRLSPQQPNAQATAAGQPQEGERRQFKQGWGVFRNGQWVPASP